MRVKDIWEYIPIPAKLKLVGDRVTFSRLTLGYFLFSFAHFVVQIAIQAKAFTINADAASFLWNIVLQAKTTSDSFPVFKGSKFSLCDTVPSQIKTDNCQLLWDGTKIPGQLESAFSLAVPSSTIPVTSPIFEVQPTTSASTTAPFTPTSLASLTSALSSTPAFTRPIVTSTTTVTAGPTASVAVRPVDLASDDSDSESDDESDSDSDVESAPVPAASSAARLSRRHASHPQVLAAVDSQGNVEVTLTGMGYKGEQVILDKTCLWALNYPVSVLNNTKREDIVFIAFQFWVLGMSIVALLNESIPHIIASLLTHVLATGWASFQIWHTSDFRASFNQLITKGTCGGTQLLPYYWEQRRNAEIPSLVLNVVALFISVFLTWRLIKLFGWQTFKRVGASLTINRVYKFVLSLSIAIQLSVFFMVVTVALWIDQLFNGVIGRLAAHKKLYEILFIITLILILPWLVLGWFSVRREHRIPMIIFLALTVMYMIGWGVMFMSDSFRWTFATWRFFSMMAVASVMLTLTTFVLGIVCRCNFGKGLPRYLNTRESLPGDDFVPIRPGGYDGDVEKVEFPSNKEPIPTWSVTFGQGDEVPVPSQMFPPAYAGRTRMGPRFSDTSSEPFETASSMSSVRYPATAHTREPSRASSADGDHMSIRNEGGVAPLKENSTILTSPTTLQYYSLDRSLSQSSHNSSLADGNGRKQRWIIE